MSHLTPGVREHRQVRWGMQGSSKQSAGELARNATGSRVGLSRIDRILEVGQVGLNSSLYLHVERDAGSFTRQWGEQMRSLIHNESVISLDWAATDTPGIPPSVSEAFLSVNSSLPVLHIADHRREFVDRFYHSDDDYQLLQESDESPSAQSTLCALGTLIARSLYVAAGGNASVVHVIRADCQLVGRLIDCFTVDANCGELRDFFYQGSTTPSHFLAPTSPPRWTTTSGTPRTPSLPPCTSATSTARSLRRSPTLLRCPATTTRWTRCCSLTKTATAASGG